MRRLKGESERKITRAKPSLFRLFAVTVFILTAPIALGQTPSVEQSGNLNTTLAKGVAYLLSQQNADGSITDTHKNETAMTSLSIMALASLGHLPADTTREGLASQRALKFVLRDDRLNAQGYYGHIDGSRMYGHGIITLMLTEMLGMGSDAAQDELIRTRCQRAVDLILSSQRTTKRAPADAGGWRYEPNSPDSDLSVSVWQILALRSARNSGLDVPKAAIDSALQYVHRCYAPSNDRMGFQYQVVGGKTPSLEMTLAGLLALQVCDQGDTPEAAEASTWLHTRHWSRGTDRYFYYGNYYYAQALYRTGGQGTAPGQRLLESYLQDLQSPDGSWFNPRNQEQSAGKVYATAMSILSLSVKHHYLPIYQK